MKNESYRFPVAFDTRQFFQANPESLPLRTFSVDFGNPENPSLVNQTLHALKKDLFRGPSGVMKHPYIVPGSVYDQLWDWDAFFCGISVCEENLDHFRGSVLNFLDHIRQDGRPPHQVTPHKPEYGSLALPLFAQWCAIIVRISRDIKWLRPCWDALCKQRKWYEQTCRGRRGLFRLSQWTGHGLDNDPVIYGSLPFTVAPVHVNCYHYREYLAMAYIAELLERKVDSQTFLQCADELARAINEYMWDERDGMYYHINLTNHDAVRLQNISWELPYKIKSWACLFPLWARVCSPRQAQILVKHHIMNTQEFLSPYGIRSLSADERMYNNIPMADPSNWQGPVWGISTFLTAYGLANYGYRKEAEQVARRLIDVFACDIQTNAMLHEYYDADTCKPLMRPGFVSWNLLAVRILDDIKNGMDPFCIPSGVEHKNVPYSIEA